MENSTAIDFVSYKDTEESLMRSKSDYKYYKINLNHSGLYIHTLDWRKTKKQ